ncbi:hypothetical protein SAMN05216338_1009101 [Bradyrhizobium sp. Rc2d]|uniref:hypothetical protein n=1 Tax=Bradyrhizobium sp. Rc2d TaxID=1855321 RepID=UPI00088BE1E6|nr:hypothetical protein [Bradyrhizobium sp. Rc2d]SDH44379.1 hypothetical protein SAMN05216338_1009101 [Bradyrhizobium sp. Rc2d]
MLKSISSIHQPDTRFRNLADVSGARSMTIADLQAMIEPTQFSDALPEEIGANSVLPAMHRLFLVRV